MAGAYDKEAEREREEARRYFQAGRFNEGMSALHRAWTRYIQDKQYAGCAEVKEEQAAYFQRAGINSEAAKCLNFAMSHWEAHGEALAEQGNKSGARTAYQRALAACEGAMGLDPKDASYRQSDKTRIEASIRTL